MPSFLPKTPSKPHSFTRLPLSPKEITWDRNIPRLKPCIKDFALSATYSEWLAYAAVSLGLHFIELLLAISCVLHLDKFHPFGPVCASPACVVIDKFNENPPFKCSTRSLLFVVPPAFTKHLPRHEHSGYYGIWASKTTKATTPTRLLRVTGPNLELLQR
jgi:hypothetical protein